MKKKKQTNEEKFIEAVRVAIEQYEKEREYAFIRKYFKNLEVIDGKKNNPPSSLVL